MGGMPKDVNSRFEKIEHAQQQQGIKRATLTDKLNDNIKQVGMVQSDVKFPVGKGKV